MAGKREVEKVKTRGVFEHPVGSGIWWVQYYDSDGRRRREKVGRKSDAKDLYQTRKADARRGIKLPVSLRSAGIRFKALTDDIEAYADKHHRDSRNVKSRIKRILPDFGERAAESIKPADIDNWLAENTDTPGTANRYRALFSLIFREALRNGKVSSNPARLVRQRHENNGRIRYLKDKEEQRLRAAIQELFPEHLPELVIALGTGMRLSEQYSLLWSQVDFGRKEIHLPKTKNGEARDVPMNSRVLEAFKTLKKPDANPGDRVFPIHNPRGWFETARDKAAIPDYRWHDNRHDFCSKLAMAGAGLKTIQMLAGHKTLSITARYAHLAPSTLHSAVELLVPTATTTATRRKAKKTAVAKPPQL
jgi:integrase